MKHFNLFLFSALLIFGIGLTSCDEDKQGPSLDYYSGDGFISQNTTVDTSSVVKVKFRAQSETDTIGYIRVTNDDSTYWEAYVPSLSKTNYFGLASFKAPKQTGAFNFVFSAYSANPDSVADAKLLTSRTLTITTDVATYLSKEITTGKIYHVMATTGNCAWDLLGDAPKKTADNDADKDMTQSSIATTGSTWVAGWKINTSNTTKYVKNKNFNYAKPTLREAKAAFDAGLALSFVPSVAVNDILIAKLRGQEEYAIIKITKITPTDATGTTDLSKGSLEFTYKKKQ